MDTVREATRRAFIAGAVGATVGALAQALGRPMPAAAQSTPVLLGEENTATSPTVVANTYGESGFFAALEGRRTTRYGAGVVGKTAYDGAGVQGEAAQHGYGVAGYGTLGPGVYGRSENGPSVWADAPAGGLALYVSGSVQFATSGLVRIPAGAPSVRVSPGHPIRSSTKVLVTLQSSPGSSITVQRVARFPATDEFVIYLTKPALQRCTVAWLLFE